MQSTERRTVTPAPRRRLALAMGAGLAVVAMAACGPAPDADAAAAAAGEAVAPSDAPVLLGVDVLFRDSVQLMRGRRVGLITNHTGVAASAQGGDPRSTIDRLHDEPDIHLVALFSPEHGIQGRAEAGERVASGHDPATGLPIHSLYGADRKPTPEMLRNVEVLAFDIQDIGSRYYTYVWTMALAMEAAGEAGIPFVVLDRPNPIGGRLVQGNVLDPAYTTFVGLYPVPMRHGLTVGELARLLVGEFGLEVDLRVVAMDGWRRGDWHDRTGQPWIPPSPNMPTLESAAHYPGTCLFEGTNLSVGRGTAAAFQQIGAPWLDADAVVAALTTAVDAGTLRGVRFEAVSFTPEQPGDGKFGGQQVRGVRFHATDRGAYDPTRAAVAALIETRRLHADRLRWNTSHFDRLAGTDRLRLRVAAGAGLEAATGEWAEESAAFEARRRPYLLYGDR